MAGFIPPNIAVSIVVGAEPPPRHEVDRADDSMDLVPGQAFYDRGIRIRRQAQKEGGKPNDPAGSRQALREPAREARGGLQAALESKVSPKEGLAQCDLGWGEQGGAKGARTADKKSEGRWRPAHARLSESIPVPDGEWPLPL
jgi:hypothetical protein